MANLNLKFLRGLQSALPTTGTDGYFYLTTDTHRLFTSIDGKVVPVNEGVTTVANLGELTSITDANAGDFFYCTQENILCVYNGQTFVQINPDTGMTSVEVVGNGNAVTAASYDAATRKLTLTMGETFATKNYVGEIPADATATDVVGYIQEKTAHIATDTALEELTDRVTTAEGEIDALQADSHTHTFVDSDVEDAIAKKHAHTFADADVVDAISKKHAHTFNETELNKIVEGDVAKWNGVAADHLTSADKTTLENAIKEAKKAGTDANTNIETYKVANDARVLAVEEDVAEIVDGTNGILAQAKGYSDGKLATARTEISAEIDADVKVVADDLAGYKTSNDAALAAVKATADAAAVKTEVNTALEGKVDKETGKSLVDNAEITKLAGVSAGANKVEASENGKIKIDGVDTVVYTHPEKHAIAEVDGLQAALDGKQAAGNYSVEGHKHVKADITDFAHTHISSEITDLDATIKGYGYATKTELGDVDAKFANYKTAEAQKAIDDEQDRRLGVIEGDYLKAADIADFETKENVKKVSDDLAAYVESNDEALAGVKATAEAARTEDEVNSQIDTKIAALNLGTTYEPIGAEQRAKDYVDGKLADANLGQYTTEQEVKDIVDGVIAGAVDGDTITGLANLVEYINTHGGEAAEMGSAIDVLEGKVEAIEGKPAYGITATQISNWDNEVGAKALAETKTTTAEVKEQIEAYGYATTGYADGKADAAKDAAIADAATKYETIGTAQGIVDGLKLSETYEPIGAEGRAIAAAKTETENQVKALAGEGNTSTVKKNADDIASLFEQFQWGEF